MKYYFIFFLMLFSSAIYSQEDAWVYFKDKPNAQASFDNPLLMLTQRALDRRTNQNIALELTDIPLEKSYINQIKSSSGITIKA
ncbi:MAG: peptidase S8, partial [Flavobacterium sp.]